MSIRSKLTILFLAVAMIPLFLVSALTFDNYKDSLQKAYFLRLQDLASFRSERIEQYFAELKTYITIIQNTYAIKRSLPVLVESFSQPLSPEAQGAKEVLDQTLRENQAYLNALNILILNKEGEVAYATNPAYSKESFAAFLGQGQKAIAEEKDKIYISEIFLDKALENKPAVLLLAHTFDSENNPNGAIVIEADLAPIYRMIRDTSGLGNTGETLLGKKSGKQIVFLNPLRNEPGAALNKFIDIGASLAGPMQEAAQGKAGAGELIDYRGERVVAAWRYIPALGWGIVAKIDAREAYADIENLRNLTFLILGIIFVLAGAVAFSIARSISGPINTLSKGVEVVGSGDLDYKIQLNSQDEIGQLAAAFDTMTRNLKAAGASRDAERQRLFSVLEALPVYVVLLDEDYRVPFANKFFRERFGDSMGRRCYEYLFKRDAVCENCESYKVMKTNAPHHWEWAGPDKRNYDIYDYPFIDSDGSKMILEMGIDVTAQKQAQERLRAASLYARTLIEASLDPLVTINSFGKVTDVNEATISATGKEREELIGTDFSSYFTEPEKAQAGYRQVFAKGSVTDYPLTMRHKNGKLTDVLYNATLYKDPSGNVMGVFAAARDVTLLNKAEAEVRKHRQHLEELVNERTLQLQAEIEERKLAEEELKASELRYRRLFESAKDGILILDFDTGLIVDVNPFLIELLGYSHETFLEKHIWDIGIFKDLVASKNAFLRLQTESFIRYEDLPLAMRDGNKIDVEFVSNVYFVKDKKVIQCNIRNVTERKRAEEALAKAHAELEQKVVERTSQLLQANELLNAEIIERQNIEKEIRARNALLRLAAKANSRKEYLDAVVKLLRGWSGTRCVGIRLLSEDGKAPYESYAGFSEAFWEKENWLSVKKDKCFCIRAVTGEFQPEDAAAVTPQGSFYCRDTAEFVSKLSEAQKAQLRGQCIREGFQSLAIIPIRFKEKIIGAIHFADEKKDLPDPKVIHNLESLAMRVGEDVIKFNLTDRINKSTEFLEKVFSTTNFRIAYMDVNFNFIRVDQAYAQMAGQTPEFFVGKNHFDIYPDAENEKIFQEIVRTGEVYTSFDKPYIYKGQPERKVTYWDWSLQPLKDTSGKVDGLVLFLVDTTKRKEAEEELAKTQMQLADAKRLSDIGTLAATVAHELRNPLAAIQMASYNIKRKAQNPILDKHLLTIENKVNESEQIISNLLFYSRLKPPRYEDVGVYKIIDECVTHARNRFAKEKVSLQVNINALKQIHIEADPLQLKEVFGNILNNAYESQTKEEKRVEIKAESAGGYIKVMVQDHGEGIDKHNLERVFDPFFTTKARGTGLGLTVCKQIINFHGGSIDIASEKDKGTLVSIQLPVKKELKS